MSKDKRKRSPAGLCENLRPICHLELSLRNEVEWVGRAPLVVSFRRPLHFKTIEKTLGPGKTVKKWSDVGCPHYPASSGYICRKTGLLLYGPMPKTELARLRKKRPIEKVEVAEEKEPVRPAPKPLKAPKGISRRLPQVKRRTCMTDAGMCAIWDPNHFRQVVDFDAWAGELQDTRDMTRHIKVGHLVPLNIHSDGFYRIEVRVGSHKEPASLSQLQRRFLECSSKPYLFQSTGWLCFSGIEYLECKPGKRTGVLYIPRGKYVVTVHLLESEKDPGPGRNVTPRTRKNLAGFVVLVDPVWKRSPRFRTAVSTFAPSALGRQSQIVNRRWPHLI